MGTIYNYKSLSMAIKDMDRQTRTVAGYFSAFDKVDSYGDVVRKGAFAKTIAENGPKSAKPRIKHLLNHDVTMPIGNLVDLYEDSYGLAYRSEIGSNNAGEDFIKMVDSKLITEHSFGYRVIKQNQLTTYDKAKEGEAVYELVELKMYEGSSLTGWGVNQYTPLTSTGKSLSEVNDRIKRLEKFCRDSSATDETIEALLLEMKQLMQLVQDMEAKQDATQPEQSTVPDAAQPDWGLIALSI